LGNKDGLIVALSQRAFDLLGAAIAELPTSADPAADLVEAGVAVFRASPWTTPRCSGSPSSRPSGRVSSPARHGRPQPPRWPA